MKVTSTFQNGNHGLRKWTLLSDAVCFVFWLSFQFIQELSQDNFHIHWNKRSSKVVSFLSTEGMNCHTFNVSCVIRKFLTSSMNERNEEADVVLFCSISLPNERYNSIARFYAHESWRTVLLICFDSNPSSLSLLFLLLPKKEERQFHRNQAM